MSNTKTLGPTRGERIPRELLPHRDDHQQARQAASQIFRPSVSLPARAPWVSSHPGPPGFPQTVPPIYFNNFSIGVNTLTTYQPNNTWQFSDSFSKVLGAHTLKFGGEFRYLQINERNTCAPNGDFTFNGSETGIDFADFLIGAPVSYNQCSQQFLDSRTRYGGAYVQDTWKVKPNLTIEPGPALGSEHALV